MENKLCPSCGKTLRFIPAGTSKTKIDAKTGKYKEYDAFYACPDNCKFDQNEIDIENTEEAPTGLTLAERVENMENWLKTKGYKTND